MEALKVFHGYGTLVKFKEHRDIWVCDMVYNKDGGIYLEKIPDSHGLDHIISYQDNEKPAIASGVSAIYVNDVSQIEIVELWDAIRDQRLFYNHFIEFNERTISFHSNGANNDQIKYCIDTAKKSNCVVMLFHCTNNDDRFYIPVVASDKIWDVRVRWRLYQKNIQFINNNS